MTFVSCSFASIHLSLSPSISISYHLWYFHPRCFPCSLFGSVFSPEAARSRAQSGLSGRLVGIAYTTAEVNSSFSPPSPHLVLAYRYHVRLTTKDCTTLVVCLTLHTQHCAAMATIATLGDDRTDLRLGLWASTRPKRRRPSPSSSGRAYWMVEMLRFPFSGLIVRFAPFFTGVCMQCVTRPGNQAGQSLAGLHCISCSGGYRKKSVYIPHELPLNVKGSQYTVHGAHPARRILPRDQVSRLLRGLESWDVLSYPSMISCTRTSTNGT